MPPMWDNAWFRALTTASSWLDNQDNQQFTLDPLGESRARFAFYGDCDFVLGTFTCTFEEKDNDLCVVDFFCFDPQPGKFVDSKMLARICHYLPNTITVDFTGCIREDTDERQAQWAGLIFEALQVWLKGLNKAVKDKITLPAKRYAEIGVGV